MNPGSSKRQQARNERELQDLLRVPGNDVCAECQARNPGWASYSLGIFLCVRCASYHRSLGTHISRVKSISMDLWSADQVDTMKRIGNVKSNRLYNPRNVRPTIPLDTDMIDSTMERFIKQKYQHQALSGETPTTRHDTGSTASSDDHPPPPPPKPFQRFGPGLRAASSTFPLSRKEQPLPRLPVEPPPTNKISNGSGRRNGAGSRSSPDQASSVYSHNGLQNQFSVAGAEGPQSQPPANAVQSVTPLHDYFRTSTPQEPFNQASQASEQVVHPSIGNNHWHQENRMNPFINQGAPAMSPMPSLPVASEVYPNTARIFAEPIHQGSISPSGHNPFMQEQVQISRNTNPPMSDSTAMSESQQWPPSAPSPTWDHGGTTYAQYNPLQQYAPSPAPLDESWASQAQYPHSTPFAQTHVEPQQYQQQASFVHTAARYNKDSILALYNQPMSFPRGDAVAQELPLHDSTQNTTVEPALRQQRRSVTMPTSFPKGPSNDISRNPFTALTSKPSEIGRSAGHVRAESQEFSGNVLASGRHSPDAFADLSAKYI